MPLPDAGIVIVSPSDCSTPTAPPTGASASLVTELAEHVPSPPVCEEEVPDEIDVTATNLATASINVKRAHVNCQVNVKITSDGPLTVTLPSCGRTVHGG